MTWLCFTIQFLCFTHILFTAQAVLTVSVPKLVQEPSDVVVQKNHPASLHCIVTGSPKPTITWWHNGRPVSFSNNGLTLFPNGTLHFSSIRHSKTSKPHQGYYQCVASSQNSRYVIVSRKASLKVAGISSRISIRPSSLRVTNGDTARFYCHIRNSIPRPTFRWKFKGAFLNPSSKYTMLGSSGVLQIHNVKNSDDGSYTCVAQNPVNGKKHESSHSTLTVTPDYGFPRQPRITRKPSSTNATRGSLVILECIVTGKPKPNILWTKDGSPVAISGNISIVGESNLQFSSVKVSDTGFYSCEANSNTNKVTATAELNVEYPPMIVEAPKDMHLRILHNAKFKCVVDGNPEPVVEWLHNGKILHKDDYIKIINDSLIYEQVWTPDDLGYYQCIAINKLGSIQASAKLFIYRQGEVIPTSISTSTMYTSSPAPVTVPTTPGRTPTAPQNVTAIALNNEEILVRWSPPADPRGRIIRYGIFYTENIPGGVSTSDIETTSGNSLSYSFKKLRPNTEYTFYVLAENDVGRGMVSDLAKVQTRDNSWAVPGPPQKIQAIAVSDSSIRVTWMKPSRGLVAGYVIYYKAEDDMQEKKDFTKHTTRQLTSLNPYTKYYIRVVAENKYRLLGQPVAVEAVTKSGVPEEAPENFVLQPDISGTALSATWKPLMFLDGKIDFYIIMYRKEGTNKTITKNIPGGKSTFIIRNLEEKTMYEAKIAAGTDTGQGPYTETWARAITRPGNCHVKTSPGKPYNMKATARGSVIHVIWQPPVDKVDVCVEKYLLAWGPGAPGRVNTEVDNHTFQYIIGQNPNDKLRPNQQYVVKLMAYNKQGNGLDVQAVVNIKNFGRPKEYLTNMVWKALSSSAIKLTWEDPLVTSSRFMYHVTYILNQKVTYSGNTTNKAFNVTKLKAATHYTFNVRRNNDHYNTSVIGVTLETKPGAPVDLNGNPSETTPTHLDLHWQPPEQPNGKILMYEIRYSLDREAKLKLWGKVGVNGSELMTTMTLTDGSKYFFKMRARTRAGWGPYSKTYAINIPLAPLDEETTAAISTVVASSSVVAKQTANNFQDKTLWIVVAVVAALTLVAIIIISVILCKKRTGEDLHPRKPPPKPTYKPTITVNGSVKKKSKDEKRPDLWINETDNMEMKPLNPDKEFTTTAVSMVPIRNSDPDPLIEDSRKFDPERSSFSTHNSDNEGDWHEKDPMLPRYPPAVQESGKITPSPPMTPVKTYSPDPPENVNPYPVTSTPRHDTSRHRPETKPASDIPQNPAPRSYVYDADFFGSPNRGVPVYPMRQPSAGSPYRTLPPVKPKPLVSPNDDIQIPPPTYSRHPRIPNGLSTLPPRYDDVMRRKQKSENDIAVADLEKEIAGLEGLMKDLNDITSSQPMV